MANNSLKWNLNVMEFKQKKSKEIESKKNILRRTKPPPLAGKKKWHEFACDPTHNFSPRVSDDWNDKTARKIIDIKKLTKWVMN